MRKSFTLLGWAIALLLTAVNPCLAAAPNDGIPESWRAQYFGTNGVDSPQAAAIADPDGDGASNYQEFLAGTNPADASSNDRKPRWMNTYAGSIPGFSNGPLSTATFTQPVAINRDTQGRVWVVDAHCIRMIDTNGIVSTVAGSADYGYADGPGLQARFQSPCDIAFDSIGNAFVTDFQNHRIRKIDTNGMVSTFAGSTSGYLDGTGTNAQFSMPATMTVDSQDNIYLADFNNTRVRKLTPEGVVTTFAGSGRGFLDGDRLAAKFDGVAGVSLAPDGSLYVADWSNGALRKISTNGMVTTVLTGYQYMERVLVDAGGNIYITHSKGSSTGLHKFNAAWQELWGFTSPYGFRDGDIAIARCGPARNPLLMPDGNLVTVDFLNARLRLITIGSAPLVVFEPATTLFTNLLAVTITSPVTNGIIRYTVDGSEPTTNSPAFSASVNLTQSATIKAVVFVNGFQVSQAEVADYTRFFDPAWVPVITSQPANVSVPVGGNATLQVTATGLTPMTYQWRLNDTNLAGATSASLSLNNITAAQAGQYSVVVGNAYGSATGVVANLTVIVQSCATPPAGMVAWLPAEGNGVNLAGGSNATLAGGVAFTPGKVGQAFDLDGVNDTITIPANTNFNTSSLSFEGWIFPRDSVKPQPLAEFTINSSFGVHLWLNLDCNANLNQPVPGALMANFMDTSGIWHFMCSPAGAVSTGVWNHVVVTYDNSSGIGKIFLNGTNVTTTTFGQFTPRTSGSLNLGSRSPSYFFNGKIDEFAMYNRALSANEIVSIYNAGSAGKCGPQLPPVIANIPMTISAFVGQTVLLEANVSGSSPISLQWQFGGVNLPGATNTSLRLLDVTLEQAGQYSLVASNAYGATTRVLANVVVTIPNCVPPAPGLTGWWPADGSQYNAAGGADVVLKNGIGYAEGKVGQTFVLDGVNDEINLPASSNLDFVSFSMEGWLFPNDLTKAQPVAEFLQVGGTLGTHFWLNLGQNANLYSPVPGSIFGNIRSASGADHIFCSTNAALQSNQWQHLALTYDFGTGEARIYRNGIAVGSANVGQVTQPVGLPLILGARPSTSSFFSGKLDEFAVYNRALTTSEILAIYNAGSAGKCGPQVPPSVAAPVQTNLVFGVGEPFTLQPTVSGTPPFAFQWFLNGAALTNATSQAFTIPVASTNDAGEYTLGVSNAFGSVTGLVAQVSVVVLPPAITTQPASQTVLVGGNATFNVVASGSPPKTYQWYFNGAVLADATNATLLLSAIKPTNAGPYQVVVANSEGSATSAVATLTIQYPPAQVLIGSPTVSAGTPVAVPVFLVANGNENAMQFSVTFSTTRLTLLEVELGAGAANVTVLTNNSQLASGRIGVLLSLPIGATFPAGTQEVARIRFLPTLRTTPTMTTLAFGDLPTGRRLVDAQARTLSANYTAGMMTILPAEYEADVAPLGMPDHALDIGDWVQVGRFVAGLDPITNATDFQRADCAPRSEGGNGVLSITDWVQAGRYAAVMDPPMILSGPTAATPPSSGLVRASLPPKANGETPASQIAIVSSTLIAGQTNRVIVSLTALGNETALGFSLAFDPAKMTFVRGTLVNTSAPTSLNINSSLAASGKLAVVVGQEIGTTFEAGSNHLIALDFAVAGSARGSLALSFSDTPLAREVSDVQANVLAANWLAGNLPVALPPLQVVGVNDGPDGKTLTFSWPAGATFLLEYKDSLQATTWTTVPATPIQLGNVQTLSIQLQGGQKYFRIRAQ